MGKRKKPQSKQEEQSTTRRTRLPDPVPPPQPPPQPQPAPRQPRGVYEFVLERYTEDCFVDGDTMVQYNACVARGYFKDPRRREVLVVIPIESFFNLHTADPNAPFLWECLSLEGYFALPPWGPDIRRAWEAYTSLD